MARAGSEEEAELVRSRVRNDLNAVVLAELDLALGALAGDEPVHIPRLSVHLNLPSAGTPAEVVAALFREELASLDGVPGLPVPASAREPLRESAGDALIHYLETGVAAWHLSPASSETPRRLAGDSALRLPHLLNATLKAPTVERRLRGLIRLFELLPPAYWVEAAAIPEQPVPRFRGAPPPEKVLGALAVTGGAERARLAAVVLLGAHTPDRELSQLASVVSSLFGGDLPAMPPGAQRWVEAILHPVGPDVRRGDASPAHLAPQAPPSADGPTIDNEVIASLERALLAPDDASRTAPRSTDTGPGPIRPPETQVIEPFGLPAPNAGIVVLNPFLTAYLGDRGVEWDGSGIDQPALPRAAALLHLLATGRDPAEFELGFVKVLLGLHPEAELPLAPARITHDDRAEATSLLQSVIGHWRSLGNTSIEGLRSTFLQRPGLLYDDGQGWLLRVEGRGFDMLMEGLPWGYETIKLPWMSRPVFTEWIPG